MAAYGSFKKIVLGQGEEIIIDNGYFLAAEKNFEYDVVKLGKTLTSSFFGGEGFGMKFVGPGTVYMQSKNLTNFALTLSSYMPSKGGSGTNNSLLNFSFGSGGEDEE